MQLYNLENPAGGWDSAGKPFTLRPMLFYVGLLDVLNKALHDQFFRENPASKVCACCCPESVCVLMSV